MKARIILLIVLNLIFASALGQQTVTNITLENPLSSGETYIARDYILLKPGFSFKASADNKFNATINSCALFPSNNNTYITTDGNITSDPSNGGVVGKFTAQLDISPSGGATYSIPINCPEGIHNMQPQIALTYNSQNGNGVAGWGWSIEGTSMISRTNKNYYYDNERSGVIWDKTSPLTLDGQRLIINGTYNTDSIEYRTENDESNRIVGYEIMPWGPKYFKVYQKNGNTLIYGNTSSIASYYPLRSWDPGLSSSSFYNLGWALYKITDPNNNFIEFEYNASIFLSPGSPSYSNNRLESIIYGHDENGNKQIVGSLFFSYDINDQIPVMYIDRQRSINQNILKKITVKGGSQEIETYELNYNTVENKKYLSYIKKTNTEGESLLPLEFTWSQMSHPIELTGILSIPQTPLYKKYTEQGYGVYSILKKWGDVNGDGIQDMWARFNMKKGDTYKFYWVLYKNNGGSLSLLGEYEYEWKNNKTTILYDLDNDGCDEIYMGGAGASPYYTLTCYKYQNGKLVASPQGNINIELSASNYNKKEELISFGGNFLGNGTIQFLVCTNTTICGFSEPNVSLSNFQTNFQEFYLTDINGNGKDEIMVKKDNTTTFYEYTKNSQSFQSVYVTNNFAKEDKICIGDFNGDGNTDIVCGKYSHLSGFTTKWTLWFSNGYEFIDSNWELNNIGTERGVTVISADINQDGKSDLIFKQPIWINDGASKATINLLINNGQKFITAGQIECNVSGDITFCKFGSSSSKNIIMDNAYLVNPQYCTLSKNISYNKITGIKNASEDKYTLTYKSVKSPYNDKTQFSTDQNITTAFPPEFEVIGQITGPLFNRQYSYTTPLIHKQGKGFFGFKTIQMTDNIQKIITINENDLNTQYYVTYPKNSVTKTTGGQLISKNENNYIFTPQQKAFYLQLKSRTETDYLKNVIITKMFDRYDNSNNPQTVETKYGNTLSEIQNITYTNKGSWCYSKISEIVTTKKRSGEADYTTTIKYTYDNKGNMLSETKWPNSSFETTTFYSNYDRYGNPQTIKVSTNGEVRTSYITYTNSGRFKKELTDYLNNKVSYNFEENRGLLLSETDRLGSTIYQYDNFGQLIKTTTPDKIEKIKLLKWADNSGNAPTNAKYYEYNETSGITPTTIWYNSYDQEIRKDYFGLNSQKIQIDKQYNSKGLLTYTSEPYFPGNSIIWAAINSYDNCNRVTQTITPAGTSQWTYNNLSVTETSPSHTIIIQKNELNETISQTTDGKKVSYIYYSSGLMKTATPENGFPIKTEYDITGNRTKIEDPDAGIITSQFNAWGDIIKEEQNIHNAGAKIITSYSYEKGILQSVNINGEVTGYTYDSNYRPIEISINNKHTQSFSYDNLDRIISTRENIKNEKNFTTQVSYDSFGRIKKEIYPSGYSITKTYDSYGNLTGITDSNNKSCWKALSSNAKGQLTKIAKGDLSADYQYNNKGLLSNIYSNNIINMNYSFDNTSNLTSRNDLLTGQNETFTYDAMNRLMSWNIFRNGTLQKENTIDYNQATGNINMRSDLGYSFNYGEGNSKPHALTSINGTPDIIPKTNQYITYTDFKKIKTITEGNNSLTIDYGVDQERKKGLFTINGNNLTRYYLGNYEKEIDKNGNIKDIHYISGENGLACINIRQTNKDTLYYVYCDYQGNILTLTNETGTPVEKYAYDPWGKRRDPLNWINTDNRLSFKIHRGYTAHEHLDNFGLINMNGRVYDPTIGMFLSPDPYIQSIGGWIGYNRYAYCLNNPLSYIDPDGEMAWFVPVIIGAVFGAYTGGVIANNGNYNPIKWDYSSGKTWGYMLGGAIAGGLSGALAVTISISGMPLANTIGIISSSSVNSAIMTAITGGKIPLSISFGIASFNFSSGEWGYIGKKGNKWYETLGYGLGALANLSDILTGNQPKKVDLITEHSDGTGHSAIVKGGTRNGGGNDPSGIISVGPNRSTDPDGSWHWMKGTNQWDTHSSKDDTKWINSLYVNEKTINSYANWLNKMTNNGKLKYSVELSSCVTHTSIALNLSGLFNIGLHPYLLSGQMYLWANGLRPWTFNYLLNQ